MSRIYHAGLYFIGAVSLCTSIASADVIEFQVAKLHLYEQSASTPPATPSAYSMDSYIDMANGDATLVTLNGAPLVEEFPGSWSIFSEFASQSALDAAFPGLSFTLHIEGGALGVRHETLILASPTIYPGAPALTPTSFNATQNADSTQDLFLEWSAPDANTNAVFLSVYDATNDIDIFDGDLPVGQTSFLISSASLNPDQDYEIEIAFANGNFGSGQPAPGFGGNADSVAGYASITTVSFHTGTGLPCLDIDRGAAVKIKDFSQTAENTEPINPDLYSFDAFINTTINGAVIAWISDGVIANPLNEYEPGFWDTDGVLPTFTTKAQLDVQFPSNTLYTLHIEGGTMGMRDQGIMIGADNYPPAPYLTGTGYSDLQGMDPSQALTINWAPAPGSVLIVIASIFDVVNDLEVLNIELPSSATSITIAANDLLGDMHYEAQLLFVVAPQALGDDCPGFGFGSEILGGFASATSINFTTMSAAICTPDLNDDGTLNFFDISAFLSAFAARDPVADFNGDGTFNFFDISTFLAAFSAGCP